jgi:hypothetical protein
VPENLGFGIILKYYRGVGWPAAEHRHGPNSSVDGFQRVPTANLGDYLYSSQLRRLDTRRGLSFVPQQALSLSSDSYISTIRAWVFFVCVGGL